MDFVKHIGKFFIGVTPELKLLLLYFFIFQIFVTEVLTFFLAFSPSVETW